MADLPADIITYIGNLMYDKVIVDGKMTTKNDILSKPTWHKFVSMRKSFTPSGLNVDGRVTGDYISTVTGYTGDDAVTYDNPSETKNTTFSWKEHHSGISITHTELKALGFSVSEGSGRIPTRADIMNIGDARFTLIEGLQDKMYDLKEGIEKGFNSLLWDDGTSDTKAFAGLLSILVDDPTAAGTLVGGLSTVSNTWWRNKVNLAVTTSASGQELTEELQRQFRLMMVTGKVPNYIAAGTDFIERYEGELRRNSQYSQNGLAMNGKGNDTAISQTFFKNIPIVHEPRLDAIGTTKGGSTDYAKRAYLIDMDSITLRPMKGEWMKKAIPARPEDKYVWYCGQTSTLALTAKRLESSCVLQIS